MPPIRKKRSEAGEEKPTSSIKIRIEAERMVSAYFTVIGHMAHASILVEPGNKGEWKEARISVNSCLGHTSQQNVETLMDVVEIALAVCKRIDKLTKAGEFTWPVSPKALKEHRSLATLEDAMRSGKK